MIVFNYGVFARTFSLAMSKQNKTKIAQTFFISITEEEDVLNRFGEPYNIDSKVAKSWFDNDEDIPEPIRIGAEKRCVKDGISYFIKKEVIGIITVKAREQKMLSKMLERINDSNFDKQIIEELNKYYAEDKIYEFIGNAFLYSLSQDNTETFPIDEFDGQIDADIIALKERIKKTYSKPEPIQPPKKIATEELDYVGELYRVYEEYTGRKIKKPIDLDQNPKLKNHFVRQRKDYYKAETIHRALRDTILLDECDYFVPLKDEMYDGIIDTSEKDYESGYKRLNSVMEQAVNVPLSNNLRNITLDWVGSGEKKGICHMLVNDKRLKWIDDENE